MKKIKKYCKNCEANKIVEKNTLYCPKCRTMLFRKYNKMLKTKGDD